MITEQYVSQKVLSASPMELILMLYDGGLRSLSRALDSFDIDDDIVRINRVHENLVQAQNFITELACSLDVERGGEMAVNLERLYEFMLHHLAQANTRNSKRPVEEVQGMLRDLRDGWAHAMESVPREDQPETIPVTRTTSFNFSG